MAGAFQVKDADRRKVDRRRKRVTRRLRNTRRKGDGRRPVMSGGLPRYEMADRVVATKAGGLGAVHAMVRRLGLPAALDSRLEVLKRHQPYHESDHVLALAYSYLAGGTRLQDLDLLREDEALLNMLGARRLPDPTTAGDFLRRFEEKDVNELQRLLNEKRVEVWKRQPAAFRARAVIDADGTVAGTTGEKKLGMDYSYHKKTWGYHPLLVSFANTREPLFLVNRPGNVPSHKDAASVIDEAIALVTPVFKEVAIRGDTDFSLTVNFDRWTEQKVNFVFGYDAQPNLVQLANELEAENWKPLVRPPKYVSETTREQRPSIKEDLVVEKGWKNLVLLGEDVAEFAYTPAKCSQAYRMIALRKKIEEKQGQSVLVTNYRYFFYVTNDVRLTVEEVVHEANDRCDQENLIGQLKSGVNALSWPAHDLVSNWAHMVIVALAWTLKAWFALTQPRPQDRPRLLRMEFRGFLNLVVLVPAQVVRSGRRLIVRLLAVTSMVSRIFSSLEARLVFS
jgi:hypothetical protein